MNPADIVIGAAIGAGAALLVVVIRLAVVGVTRRRPIARSPFDKD